MAELPVGFWSGWIIVLSVGGFVVLALLIYSVYFSAAGDSEHAHQVWDETLREGANPAPIWWFWMILALMVFSVIYLLLYPGMGSFKGALKWSQEHRLARSNALYRLEFDPLSERLMSQTLAELGSDPEAMRAAESLFGTHCGSCHGADGGGQANQFPDLFDQASLWGTTPEQIEHSIRKGRIAVMPPWGAVLGDEAVTALARYVRALSSDGGKAPQHAAAQSTYATTCAACHGQEGQGNPLMGAPALNDDIWLYGGDDAAVETSIRDGRQGVMPAQEGRLSDLQIRLLMAWITSQPVSATDTQTPAP